MDNRKNEAILNGRVLVVDDKDISLCIADCKHD
jgi:hypothetical protein